MEPEETPKADPGLWPLDPAVTFLNHGSFGSCPRPVLARQREWRERMERDPVQFLARDLEGLMEEAKAPLASFLGAQADDLVPVPNATTGVNTVLRSLPRQDGADWLVTQHEYNACRNALDAAAARAGARVVVAQVPFPIAGPDDVVERILGAVTPRTTLALIDHVTSQTALVLPIQALVSRLRGRGVDTLVDGAHAPGMVPVQLDDLGAAYYTGNCHKWLCAPKGAAFLHVRRDRQQVIRPLTISHGANSPRTDRSRFQLEFGWTGTMDPTAFLCLPESMRILEGLHAGGWPALREANHHLARAARALLVDALGIPPPCPDDMLGAMASLPIPDATEADPPLSPLYADPDQTKLRQQHAVEVPIVPWPAPPHRLLRVSCQAYNHLGQYRALAEVVRQWWGGRARAAGDDLRPV